MIVSPDANYAMDGTALKIAEHINSPIPVVPITRINNFVFNKELLNLKKYVLLDYCEYNWDWNREETHLFGHNTDKFQHIFSGDEWDKFDKFVKYNPPTVYFKRELIKDGSMGYFPNLYPIEYPCWYQSPIQSKEDFEKRQIDVFFFWGHSHEARRVLHGNIWVNAPRFNYSVCDNIWYLTDFLKYEENPHKWVTLNVPHYGRHEMKTILEINSTSRISISHHGAGVKCFRTTGESPLNAVMALPYDNLEWTYEWKHMENCVRFNYLDTIETIEEALHDTDKLYDIYLKGTGTASKYFISDYVKEYILPTINKHI